MPGEVEDFLKAVEQITRQKNLPEDKVMDIVADAIAAAYRKDFGDKEETYEAEIDPDNLDFDVYQAWEVVEEVADPSQEISLEDAKEIDEDAEIGGKVRKPVDPADDFGRVAAQTAKQVVLQRVKEAERDLMFEEFKDKENTLVTGVVQQIEGDVVIVDLGKSTGVLYPSEQSESDRYYPGQRFKVFISRVEESTKEPHIVVSRSHPEMIRRLFEMEVPEIEEETVEIKGIAREAGVRSKVAVNSTDEAVDPVGSMVGRRGVRVQAVMAEIGEEKIDIVLWDEDPEQYIINALAPAEVDDVELIEDTHTAEVEVDPDQLSLAIGKNGQNVRLASQLTGWQIDVKKEGEEEIEETVEPEEGEAEQEDVDESSESGDDEEAEETALEESEEEEEMPEDNETGEGEDPEEEAGESEEQEETEDEEDE